MKDQKGFAPIVIALIILVLAGVGGTGYFLINKQLTKKTACTEEAKICPDGSSVGRTGPNCEFASCPEVKVNETVDWKIYTNNKYNYQISYSDDIYTIENITSDPEKAMTDDNVTLYDIKSVQKTKECECGEYVSIHINAYSNPKGLSLGNYIKENIKHWASDYSSLFINEQASLNGISAIKIGTEREQYYILEKNNTIFSIGGFIDMDVINTFRFISLEQGWKIYKSAANDFQINYPADFSVQEGFETETGATLKSTAFIFPTSYSSYFYNNDVLKAAVTVDSTNCNELPIGKSVTVGELIFIKSTIHDSAMGGYYTDGYAYNIIHDNLCYMVTLQIEGDGPGAGANDGQGPLPEDLAPSNAKDKFNLIFEKMIKTFKFIQ